MNNDRVKELEAQTALALAALGTAFAQTLAEDDTPPAVLTTLQNKAAAIYDHLQNIDAHQAALMFGTFVRALHDKSLLPEK